MRSDARFLKHQDIIKVSIDENVISEKSGNEMLAEARRLCGIRNIRVGDWVRADTENFYRTVTFVILDSKGVAGVRCTKATITVERIAEVVTP